MFTSGGGGLSLPRIDGPLELLIVVLVIAALTWLTLRVFNT